MRNRTRRLTAMAMMLALILVLSYIEHLLPPLPYLPPQVRLGLSNIVVMYMLFSFGVRSALLLSALKSFFVVAMRGPTAGLLSICGGLLSVGVLWVFAAHQRGDKHYIAWSILGAIAHNIGQMAAASLLLQINVVLYYLPILIVSGALMGGVTGFVLRIVLPYFDKAYRNDQNEWKHNEKDRPSE